MNQTPARPRLVLALHFHQPTGNVEEVFVEAHDACYAALLGALERFGAVRMGLHVSGPLLEWMEGRRPETISRIAELATRGQVEILGGGWQEPILPTLPARDALGQMRMMRYECARLFGTMPRGMWLAERVWEPELPALIHDAGYAFTFVDDTHLRYSGVLDEHVTGLFVTEKAGKPVVVLPISKALRYTIPFKEPEATTGLLASRPGETWTYGDDGEKFGLWPGTREWVWDRGWLERFFTHLTRESEEGRLEIDLPHEAVSRQPPRQRIYLPSASYREMGEWALPPAAARRLRSLRTRLEREGLETESEPFVRGGAWSSFLARYPEANWLHKHMLRVSDKVAAAEKRDRLGLGTLSPAVEEARRDLYRSQTNCAYWHGLFGGLYLPHLRRALWRHLIAAENAVDRVEDGPRLTRADLDCDGREEILVETPLVSAAVAPGRGACLAELVHRPARMNVLDTLARRPELYHDEEPEAGTHDNDEGIETIHTLKKSLDDEMRARLLYDPLPRRAFQEQLLEPGADPGAMETGGVTVLADPASGPWVEEDVGLEEGRQRLAFSHAARLESGSLAILKTYVVHAGRARVAVAYQLRWSGGEPLEAIFTTRLNVNLLDGTYELLDPELALADEERRLASRGTWRRAARIALVNGHEGVRVEVEASPVCDLTRYPVETVSQTESGFQLTTQGSCLVLAWPVRLESWVEWKGEAAVEIRGDST